MVKSYQNFLKTLRRFSLLFVLALAAVSCTGLAYEAVHLEAALEAGPLGVVRVAPGEAIQIRSLQSLSVLGEIGAPNLARH